MLDTLATLCSCPPRPRRLAAAPPRRRLLPPARASPSLLERTLTTWANPSFPRASVRPADLLLLLGGALFLPLRRWQGETGDLYLLPTGLWSSFLVVSDPAAARHILRSYPLYQKGLVREVAEFLFGDGFAIAEGDLWRGRRRAVLPSLHKAYLEQMVRSVFLPCSERAAAGLAAAATAGRPLDAQARARTGGCLRGGVRSRLTRFSAGPLLPGVPLSASAWCVCVCDSRLTRAQLTLDVIGLSLFNYDFDALTTDSPLIQAVYTALHETELRATDLLPVWRVPALAALDPRQRRAADAVALIRATTEALIDKCKAMVEAENETARRVARGRRLLSVRVLSRLLWTPPPSPPPPKQPRQRVCEPERPVGAALPACISGGGV